MKNQTFQVVSCGRMPGIRPRMLQPTITIRPISVSFTLTPGYRLKASDQLWQERIVNDIDGQLAAKGWQKVASGGDAAVAAFGHTKENQTLNTFYDGFGGPWQLMMGLTPIEA